MILSGLCGFPPRPLRFQILIFKVAKHGKKNHFLCCTPAPRSWLSTRRPSESPPRKALLEAAHRGVCSCGDGFERLEEVR